MQALEGMGIVRSLILLSPYSKPKTGAQVRFDRLAIYLARKGCSILWISPVRPGFESFQNVSFLDIGDVGDKRAASLWMSRSILRNAIHIIRLRKSKPLLVAFGETNLIPGAIAALLSSAVMSFGIRSNVVKCLAINASGRRTERGGYPRWLNACAIAIWRFIYRRAAQVTVQTPQAKTDAVANFGIAQSRIVIIENDLPVARVDGRFINNCARVPRRVIYVGDDSAVKGFDLIVKAVDRFQDRAPTIEKMTIVGVSYSAFCRLKDRAGVTAPAIEWLSHTDELISVMAECDLLIVPSLEDQFPNIVLEALAIGLPVIGSDVDGIRHILQDEALLFEAGSVLGLLDALARVSTSDGYAHAQEMLRARAEAFRFNWEERYFELLSQVGNE